MEVAVLWDGYFLGLSKKKTKKEKTYILLKLFQGLRAFNVCGKQWPMLALKFQTIFEQLPNDLVEFHD